MRHGRSGRQLAPTTAMFAKMPVFWVPSRSGLKMVIVAYIAASGTTSRQNLGPEGTCRHHMPKAECVRRHVHVLPRTCNITPKSMSLSPIGPSLGSTSPSLPRHGGGPRGCSPPASSVARRSRVALPTPRLRLLFPRAAQGPL